MITRIRALHRELAPDDAAFEFVHTHCEIVWAIAEQLIRDRRLAVDADLVRAGCLAHDIGVHLLDGTAYIRHGVLGEQLLRERGFPEAIARFCGHHTGVGLTRDDVERQQLPIPPGDYLAETPEERLVMYADKFHSKTTPPVFLTAATYATRVARFGPGHAARFAAMVQEYGEPDLATLAARFGHPLT
ncbi:HD domain-containing protein [Paractinoplanes toevensis]|uniref:Phosphohydrolase n=1 Tax=Paractinoplanes toevensis TaxID=571911 RepID=A0A919W4S2_9ACTN|nr:HD domain-containing protein [Actinoplanes toevensis]GIM91985.1 phosphohydrolase [Actinoplanes toevensis]